MPEQNTIFLPIDAELLTAGERSLQVRRKERTRRYIALPRSVSGARTPICVRPRLDYGEMVCPKRRASKELKLSSHEGRTAENTNENLANCYGHPKRVMPQPISELAAKACDRVARGQRILAASKNG